MPNLDADAMAHSALDAIPHATPDVVAEFLLAQLPFLDETRGLAIVERMRARLSADSWLLQVSDKSLATLPGAVADAVTAQLRRLPPGEFRIEALCGVPSRLTQAERREVLDGILDGSLSETYRAEGAQGIRRDLLLAFARSPPQAWREEWVAFKVMKARANWERRGSPQRYESRELLDAEIGARNDVDLWPDVVLLDVWARCEATPDRPGEKPFSQCSLIRRLPADLRAIAVAGIRAYPDARNRRRDLASLDLELTEAEYMDLVENPWLPVDSDQMVSLYLRRSAKYFERVPEAARRQWLPRVRQIQETFWRQSAWLALLPLLDGADRQEAIDDAVAIALEDGAWSSNPNRWDLLPAEELPAMTLRLVRTASGGWGRDALIAHITNERPEAAERSFLPVLEDLSAVDPDRRLEALSALSRWLADVTAGAFSALVARLDFPAPERPPDRHLRERRMFAAGR